MLYPFESVTQKELFVSAVNHMKAVYDADHGIAKALAENGLLECGRYSPIDPKAMEIIVASLAFMFDNRVDAMDYLCWWVYDLDFGRTGNANPDVEELYAHMREVYGGK